MPDVGLSSQKRPGFELLVWIGSFVTSINFAIVPSVDSCLCWTKPLALNFNVVCVCVCRHSWALVCSFEGCFPPNRNLIHNWLLCNSLLYTVHWSENSVPLEHLLVFCRNSFCVPLPLWSDSSNQRQSVQCQMSKNIGYMPLIFREHQCDCF